MKPLPKPGDWATCVSTTYEWVQKAGIERGKSYKITTVEENGTYHHGSSCPAIIVEGVDHPYRGYDYVYLELPDFTWETEFEKNVREAAES